MGLLAHRGLHRDVAENSLAAFERVAKAVLQGIPIGVELDVRRTADGVMVTNHDPDFDGVMIAEVTHQELIHQFGLLAPPRFSDVIAVLASGLPVLVDVELKEAGYTAEALSTARVIPDEHLLVSSFLPDVVIEVKQLAPTLRTGLLIDDDDPQWTNNMQGIIDITRAVSPDVLIPHFSFLTPDLYLGVKELGIPLSTFTVDDVNHLIELDSNDEIEWICSNTPHLIFPELATS